LRKYAKYEKKLAKWENWLFFGFSIKFDTTFVGWGGGTPKFLLEQHAAV